MRTCRQSNNRISGSSITILDFLGGFCNKSVNSYIIKKSHFRHSGKPRIRSCNQTCNDHLELVTPIGVSKILCREAVIMAEEMSKSESICFERCYFFAENCRQNEDGTWECETSPHYCEDHCRSK